MTFLNQIIDLVLAMNPIWTRYLNYLIALSFFATTPYLIYELFKRRK